MPESNTRMLLPCENSASIPRLTKTLTVFLLCLVKTRSNESQQVLERARKNSFGHLENGLRKVADFPAQRKIAASEFCPSVAWVEPFKPQFELLSQEVLNADEVMSRKIFPQFVPRVWLIDRFY
jgi:hypothetical protein